MWSNFHTHTSYCDGKASIAEVVECARGADVRWLGISSHAPLPFEKPWAMKRSDLESYLNELQGMKTASNDIEVYAGLEVDFVPGQISPREFAQSLDFTVGSIHFVDQYRDGDFWEIDSTHEVFKNGLHQIFSGDVKAAVTRYFELTRQMLDHSAPTVLGHMDKIKIQNAWNEYFREDESWYCEEIKRTIDCIRRTGVIVEISTRGIYQKKCATTYPSPWIIERLCERNIPITFSSDAHHPKDIVNGFTHVADLVSRIGYRTIYVLTQGQWNPMKFNAHGIVG
jgi:histidinol-phosphatase (PHP family)